MMDNSMYSLNLEDELNEADKKNPYFTHAEQI